MLGRYEHTHTHGVVLLSPGTAISPRVRTSVSGDNRESKHNFVSFPKLIPLPNHRGESIVDIWVVQYVSTDKKVR